VSVLVPAIVSALRTADTLALALQSRAYGARSDRTFLTEIKMRGTDYVALSVVLGLLVVPLIAKYFLSVPL
jgi:energy-coupling factor transport system permease protein